MNYLKINLKNKKRKTSKFLLKNTQKHLKYQYKMLSPTKIDKLIGKCISNVPDIYPQYVIYDNKEWLFDLSKNIAQKINSQIIKFKAKKHTIFIENVAEDCVYQILTEKKVDIFKHINSHYYNYHFTKNEISIFPYLLIDRILKQILSLNSRLEEFLFDIRFGALTNNKKLGNESYAFIYGVAKYNKNSTKIGYFSNVDFQKCIFNFFVQLSNIESKLNVMLNYIKFIIKKFSLRI